MAEQRTESPRDRREAKLDELHGRLAGAVEQLVSGEDWQQAMAFAARFRSRSFNNTLLIFAQHQDAYEKGLVGEPSPSYVAGYRQWQQLGRQVQKGQPGYMIYAPVTARFATSDPADPGSWRRLDRGEKPRAGEVVRSRMVGAKPAYVWDAAQTAGDPIPEPPAPQLLKGQAPAGLHTELSRLIREQGFTVVGAGSAAELGGANGITDYTAKQVAVRSDMDPAAQVKTLAHELGHVLMHGPNQQEARSHRGVVEVEAESVALMIGAAHGMDTSDYTIPYVSTWAAQVKDQEPAEVVKATGERVGKTAISVLEQLNTSQVTDGTPPGLERHHPQRSGAVRQSPEAKDVQRTGPVRSIPEPAGVRREPVASSGVERSGL
ncbi:ImmA/IrrE family metallo-endopeptidase [Nesterenkonia salmonea]|uniref:ImmA/IrrE family metallo-endopeptidase n=1 Tax=Nesterenkonia salmonea TaxID=1804987 RepID=A0A5R9B9L1_9MICC|nr:ArdC-like ssDNA-binding domain-containing protein [Nesterenkonia salmonea]TLP92743.1 ImmA/IrrE family metallo-endopeptidase [Nesterenkonia salmonea]